MDIAHAAIVTAAQDDSTTGTGAEASIDDSMTNAAPTPTFLPSSPPPLPTKKSRQADSNGGSPDDAKSDSEAETVLLPGKDGYSPSKSRNMKLEDKNYEHGSMSGIEEHAEISAGREGKRKRDAEGERPSGASQDVTSLLGKRKRTKHSGNGSRHDMQRTGNSSGLSSVPSSPTETARSPTSKPTDSDSDKSRSPSPRRRLKQARSVGRASPPTDGHQSTLQRDKEQRRIRRQRSGGREEVSQDKHSRVFHSSNVAPANAYGRTRSASPMSQSTTRRSLSNQPSAATSGQKRRKIPIPLRVPKDRHSNEAQSDEESSAGESPQPRRSRPRNLATPPTGDFSAKMGGKKKRLMQYGSSSLAVACEHGDLQRAKEELEEHPEDLNSADNAGNTPLQVAALNGYAEICSFLIDKKCDVHCSNINKDSPLLDATENGHLDVVEILLAAGVNPRARNLEGEEPVDKIDEEGDDALAIRKALMAARSTYIAPTMPSRSSSAQFADTQSTSHNPRATTHGRSRQTGANQLYLKYDKKSLQLASAKGDEQSVINILNVLGQADPDSTVNAAKGGHLSVLSFLIALGNADPDASPVRGVDKEYATPMLAAIGGDNVEVVKLLLQSIEDHKLNPRKLHNEKTYFEIARDRRGPCWQEEEAVLKEAYDKFTPLEGSKRPGSSSMSSRISRKDVDPAERLKSKHQRTSSSSRSKVEQSGSGPETAKRGPGRPRRDDRDRSPKSERELSPTANVAPRKVDSDSATAVSENEPNKPRRKLISGKDLKGARERRASVASVKSATSTQDPAEQSERSRENAKMGDSSKVHVGRNESAIVDKQLDRARSLNRASSKDRVSNMRSDSPNKRARTSPTPPADNHHHQLAGNEHKRRRVEDEPRSRDRSRIKSSSSPDGRLQSSQETKKKPKQRDDSPHSRQPPASIDRDKNSKEFATSQRHSEIERSGDSFRSGLSKKESPPPVRAAGATAEKETQAIEKRKESERLEADLLARRKAAEFEKAEEEERRLREEARLAEEQRLEREQRKFEEELLKRESEREAAEALQKEREEAEEARERERLEQEAIAAKMREEKERFEAEQERLREQSEAEAQALARKREEQERRWKEREDAQRADTIRIFRETEAVRLSKLPPLLRWFDQCMNVRDPAIVSKFRSVFGVRYNTIVLDNADDDHNDPQEQWLLNTDAALLLGEKDLELSRYTAWERIPADERAKKRLWDVVGDSYSLVDERVRDLQYWNPDPSPLSFQQCRQIRQESWICFREMDLFFVKLSEFMFILQNQNLPHLHNMEIVIRYAELPVYENGAQEPPSPGTFKMHTAIVMPSKWKSDPNHPTKYGGLAPPTKLYVNGQLVRENLPTAANISSAPYFKRQVPRDSSYLEVLPGDPSYKEVCLTQGLAHLLDGHRPPNNNTGDRHFTPPDSATSMEDNRRSSAASSVQSSNTLPTTNGIL